MGDFRYVGNINICSICHRLRDNHVCSTKMDRFESLTFKMSVKDVNYTVAELCR